MRNMDYVLCNKSYVICLLSSLVGIVSPDHFEPLRRTGDGKKFASKYEQACRPMPFNNHSRRILIDIPLRPPSFNVDAKTVWPLANFCPGEAPNTCVDFRNNIEFREAGGVQS